MAWWLTKDSYCGPFFDWVDPEGVGEKRGLVGSGLSLSRPLSEKNVPKAARSRSGAKKLPATDVFICDYAVVCNARFRDIVEEFEPGLHLFAPIELQYDDYTPMEGRFYFFSTNVDIDCVLTDNEDKWFYTSRRGEVSPMLGLIQKRTPLEISLSKPQIEGHHLWTGGPLGWNQLFVSDDFCRAMRKARITGMQIWRDCHEVDRAWVPEDQMGPLIDKWRDYVSADRNCAVGYI